ncbi:unnamed protein product [Symbiodinium sp. CCMP2592]|nr:unnamed protein product [Symbiodinium sp. CCMP2592]
MPGPGSESGLSLPSVASVAVTSVSIQSPHWGTNSFKGCRFCRRDRTCANPIVVARATKPFLQFKSERHFDCLLCLGKIRRSNGSVVTSEQHKGFANKLATDEDAYNTHMTELAEYEASLQDKDKSRKRKRVVEEDPGSQFLLVETSSSSHSQMLELLVLMSQESGVEARQLLGILWPSAIYKQHTGEDPKPEWLTKMQIGGSTVVGVLRDPALGTYEMTDFKRAFGANVLTAADSEDAIGNEMDETWKRVQALNAVGTTQAEKDGQTYMLLDAVSSGKRKDDSFDDLLDFAAVEESQREDEAKVLRKEETREVAAPSQNKSPAATKQTKEIQASERLLLEADQMLENLANEDAIMTVKPKALGTVCDRLQNRLTPALCAIYCQGYDASDPSAAATPGMTCLEKLRQKQRVLGSVKDHLDLVAGLHETKTTGQNLYKAAVAAKSDDFKPVLKCYEIALQRAVDSAATEKDYPTMMTLLKEDRTSFNLSILEDADRQARFQEREVTRLCVSLLAEDNRVNEVASLVNVVLGPTSCLPGSSSVRKEFEMLSLILFPMQPELDVAKLEATAGQFREDKNLTLHKVMTNFPTGLLILDGVAQAVVARREDERQVLKLKEMLDSVAKVSALPDGLTNVDEMKKLVKPMETIAETYAEAGT